MAAHATAPAPRNGDSRSTSTAHTWEIDEFKNRDLVLAEIELESEDDDVAFPDWLAPAVQREVTGEPEFQNINLAR